MILRKVIIIELKKINKKNVIILLNPKNIKIIMKLYKIIKEYSPKKISAKDALMYSVLNPETSSDSPSIKSKGLRFNSAAILI